MSFLILKLIFAALAVALAVVAFLIVRRLRRDRLPGATSVPRASATVEGAPRPRGLGRKRPPPEPEGEPAPLPVRKRQLRSLSELERIEAEEAEEEEATPPPAGPPAAESPNFGQRVLTRLETAFERLQEEEISLDAYVAQVLAEQAEVDQRIAALRASGDTAQLDEALAAQESVRWCLDWANEQRGAQ